MPYHVREMFLSDPQQRAQVTALLEAEQLRLDANVDCTYGLFDDSEQLAAIRISKYPTVYRSAKTSAR